MRLFVAIPIPNEMRARLAEGQERLQQAGADVKWVERENFHLTVQFIGDVSEASLPDIQDACAEIVRPHAPFRVAVRGMSYFPKRGPTIKTLWAGVTEGADAWKRLVQDAEPWLIPFGATQNGGLVPHLTLGRVKSEKNIPALRESVAAEKDTDFGAFVVEDVVLVQSILDSQGATYTDIARWKL